jgi:Mg2+ and Co2+ transporter CorA
MRVFQIASGIATEQSADWPTRVPEQGYLWIALSRREFEVTQARVQTLLHTLCGRGLVDLHVSDLLNNQLPSHHDYTSAYDVLVFRRLAASQTETDLTQPGEPLHEASRKSVPQVLLRINTSPVGFAVFDRVLLSVHPTDCAVRDAYAERLLSSAGGKCAVAWVVCPSTPQT